jgi:hypothetical protein
LFAQPGDQLLVLIDQAIDAAQVGHDPLLHIGLLRPFARLPELALLRTDRAEVLPDAVDGSEERIDRAVPFGSQGLRSAGVLLQLLVLGVILEVALAGGQQADEGEDSCDCAHGDGLMVERLERPVSFAAAKVFGHWATGGR